MLLFFHEIYPLESIYLYLEFLDPDEPLAALVGKIQVPHHALSQTEF